MKNKINYLWTTANPSRALFAAHEKDILLVRSLLFSSIERKSPTTNSAVKEILQRKLRRAKEENLPTMFELFPWIIRDFTGLEKKKTQQIAINWLAINLYVSFLDEHLDLKTEINAAEFLGSSLLGQRGLLNLFKIVRGTKFEKIFEAALFDSANYQLVDVLEQAKITEHKFEKAKSASGKNKILVACAGALAASKVPHANFIINFTNKLLLLVQYLDDLADFEDDLKHNNITILLNEIAKDKKLDLSRNELVGELIKNRSLFKIITKIEMSLSASIELIEKNSSKNSKTSSSFIFFNALYLEVLVLWNLLEDGDYFNNLSARDKSLFIEEVEKSIVKIYLHS
ncbi:MAG TPA: hypothetical protein VE978_22735 [Chitinophagales bacterium]|nr:hypothetical protein [Chitinophagales bacterium]